MEKWLVTNVPPKAALQCELYSFSLTAFFSLVTPPKKTFANTLKGHAFPLSPTLRINGLNNSNNSSDRYNSNNDNNHNKLNDNKERQQQGQRQQQFEKQPQRQPPPQGHRGRQRHAQSCHNIIRSGPAVQTSSAPTRRQLRQPQHSARSRQHANHKAPTTARMVPATARQTQLRKQARKTNSSLIVSTTNQGPRRSAARSEATSQTDRSAPPALA